MCDYSAHWCKTSRSMVSIILLSLISKSGLSRYNNNRLSSGCILNEMASKYKKRSVYATDYLFLSACAHCACDFLEEYIIIFV